MTWSEIQLKINFRNLPLSVMEHKAGGWLVDQETGKVIASDPQNAFQFILEGKEDSQCDVLSQQM